MYAHEGEQRFEKRGPFSWQSFVYAVALHFALFLFFWGMGKLIFRTPDVIIPIDMTIVPPWAEQTDDPNPDPNPPPKEEPKAMAKPQPEPEPPKIVETKPVEAVEQIKEKPKPKDKPKEKPKPLNLREKAKLVKTPMQPPKPVDLREKATKIEPPPNMRNTGKATSTDKALTAEEFNRLMNKDYRLGPTNQIANDEVTRCYSLVSQAIKREWNKESFSWHPSLQALKVELQLGPGGAVRGFRIISGSGDAEVDNTARSALNRLRVIPGLSSMFLQKYSTLPVSMEPTGSN